MDNLTLAAKEALEAFDKECALIGPDGEDLGYSDEYVGPTLISAMVRLREALAGVKAPA